MRQKAQRAKAAPTDSDWFEVSERDWREPGFKGKKLKLIADAMVPHVVVNEIRAAGIVIDTMEKPALNQEDPALLGLTQNRGRVLLTLDGDFWDDRKYPLHTAQTGIIYVAEPPNKADAILLAFGLVYVCCAKSYPLDWWSTIKVRAHVGEFEMKMRTWRGGVSGYKMRLRMGRVEAREISGN